MFALVHESLQSVLLSRNCLHACHLETGAMEYAFFVCLKFKGCRGRFNFIHTDAIKNKNQNTVVIGHRTSDIALIAEMRELRRCS